MERFNKKIDELFGPKSKAELKDFKRSRNKITEEELIESERKKRIQ